MDFHAAPPCGLPAQEAPSPPDLFSPSNMPPLPAAPAFPVDAVLPDLLAALADHGVAVLTAPPGSGKTTRVPPALADALTGTVLVLEPRRLAARSAARFMARQRGEEVGGLVGYRVRLDSRVSARTRVEMLTEGVLTRRLLNDPELTGVSCVVFDEFHERSLQADLGLALCLEARQALRPDLKLLVMSATLDVEPLRALLGNCPILHAQGRQWPVDIRYCPPTVHAMALTGRHGAGNDHAEPARAVARAVRQALAEEEGDVLVFLPGVAEIRRTAALLGADAIRPGDPASASRGSGLPENTVAKRGDPPSSGRNVAPGRLPPSVCLHQLYGDLPAPAQDAAIAPSPAGQRKVVLATALAETSLTIEGVRVVIDAGLSRTVRYDPATDMERMVTERVTLAGADQRAGRAGRTRPGVCLRLWAAGDALAPHRRPEIQEADLTPLLLDVLSWGAQPEALPWLTPPPPAALSRARHTLELLGAARADAAGRLSLTSHGHALARLPLHPRLGQMLSQAGEHASLAACLAAILSERDPLRGGSAGADIRRRLACLRQPGHERLKRTAQQIFHLAAPDATFRLPAPEEEDLAGGLLSLAWPERLAQRRARGSFRLASGRGATLPEDDALADAPWLAIATLDAGGADGRIFLAAPLRREDVIRLHGHRLERQAAVSWDAREQAAKALSRVRLGALIVEENALRPERAGTTPSPNRADAPGGPDLFSASPADAETGRDEPALEDAVRAAVLEGIRSLGMTCLPWTDDLRQWQARVLLMRDLEPEAGWPDVSDQALLACLEDWLLPFLNGVTRRSQFGGLDLASALSALLPRDLGRRLSNEVPTSLTVPSGSSVRLDYTAARTNGGSPVLAVKLQEMFGQRATPVVASGRVPVVVHLLSPAGRPVQITRDLAGFWATGYAAVRAEMRGRYPKHPWPDDPLTAPPTRRIKPRG